MADASSFLRRLYERLRDWRREHLAGPDVRRRLSADATLARATAARAYAASAAWLARPLLPQRMAVPRWHILLRGTTYALAALLILLLGGIVYFAFEIPIDGGTTSDAAGALTVDAADGTTLAVRGTAQGEQLTYDEISPNLRKAIVAVEDRRFYSHGAVDLHGMLRAFAHDMRGGHAQGASTITQQLARLMLLSQRPHPAAQGAGGAGRDLARASPHQAADPRALPRHAPISAPAPTARTPRRSAISAPARATLTLPQAAMIAGLVRAPSALAPVKNLDGAPARAGVVLACDGRDGRDHQGRGRRGGGASRRPEGGARPAPRPRLCRGRSAGRHQDAGRRRRAGPHRRHDDRRRLQAAAETAIRTHLDGEGARKHATQAALVAIGPERRHPRHGRRPRLRDSSYNRATTAQRQPGSLFKLFVYLAALKNGMTPSTIVDDAPVTIGIGANAWQPHDFEERYEGRMPLSLAFAKSVNTVAAQLGQDVGIKTVIKTAHDLGVASPLPDVPSLALGTANVNLMEMTRAFATVASDEETLDPYLVQRIASHGKILFNRPSHYGEASEPSQAKLEMRELLADVVREGTGRGARLTVPTGGKTGTTQDFRDAWFIGSTPDVTIGVWVGNDDNSPMDGVTGGDIPVKIWRDVALAAQGTSKPHRKPRVPAQASATPPARAPDIGQIIGGALNDAARGVVAGLTPKDDQDADPGSDPKGALSGTAEVVDTATLGLEGQQVRLQGVAPMGGRAARELARYLRRREVDCTPATGGAYRCSVDGDDLATTILSNGGAEAAADAPADLAAAQETAQEQGLGIWRGRR